MCSNHHHDDTHRHPTIDPDQARQAIHDRLNARVPTSYTATAGTLIVATGSAWAILIYSGILHHDKPLTYGSAVCLAFVVALTIAAGLVTSIWLRVRRDYAYLRDDTLIGEYRQQVLLDEVCARAAGAADPKEPDWRRSLQSMATHMGQANGNVTSIAAPLLPRARNGDA